MQERFCKVVGKVLKLWERFYHREKVGKISKFQERLFDDNFKAGNGEERKGKGKLSVPPPNLTIVSPITLRTERQGFDEWFSGSDCPNVKLNKF